jgi:hypothetical protein
MNHVFDGVRQFHVLAGDDNIVLLHVGIPFLISSVEQSRLTLLLR